ncbi:MAG: hypothetical protein M3P82_02805, partial [Bacteroidota bacterium]|nr:hypothetical protein [Bacteroidota bacterium]
MDRKEISSHIDKAILILLTIQISLVSLSVAVSSIAFGIWLGLCLIQLIINRHLDCDGKLFKEIRYINIFVLLYCITEILTRFNAVYPDGAFSNIKRLLLFLIFYVSIIKVLNYKTLSRILFVNICVISLISIAELVQYAVKFNEIIDQMPFSEIRIDYFNYPLTTAEIKMMSMLSIFPLLFVRNKFVVSK